MQVQTSRERSPQLTRQADPSRRWYRYVRQLLPRDGAALETTPGSRRVWIDLGCGFGEFLSGSGELGKGAIGLDLDRRSLAEARDAGIEVVAADLGLSIPFRSGSLEGATLIEVIEHVFDADALLAELARVIRPGGWVVLTTPNVAHFTYRVRALTGHAPKQEGYHVRFFTRDRLLALIDAHGFRVDARASYGKQALLTKLARITRLGSAALGRGDGKVRYQVPRLFEPLLAQRFVWRLRRESNQTG
jgi:SAM-dependent methyltransferase